MMTRQRCAICDCDREGNVWPESADVLCDAHWTLAGVRDFVQRGALSDWQPLPTGDGGYTPMLHAGMQKSDTIAHVREQRRRKRGDAGVYPYTQVMAELAGELNKLHVQIETVSAMDSYGDWLADNHLIDWQAVTDDGRAAA